MDVFLEKKIVYEVGMLNLPSTLIKFKLTQITIARYKLSFSTKKNITVGYIQFLIF